MCENDQVDNTRNIVLLNSPTVMHVKNPRQERDVNVLNVQFIVKYIVVDASMNTVVSVKYFLYNICNKSTSREQAKNG